MIDSVELEVDKNNKKIRICKGTDYDESSDIISFLF